MRTTTAVERLSSGVLRLTRGHPGLLRWLNRTANLAHVAVYRLTEGRVGARLLGMDVLLLTTVGRRSGQPRTSALSYMRDGDAFLVLNSGSGSVAPPNWYLNARALPEVQVQCGRERFPARMEILDETETARVWPRMLDQIGPHLATYRQTLERQVRVVRFRRVRP
jgi:deazaflavin-dependent oxidoreductase (nitroreductase family)